MLARLTAEIPSPRPQLGSAHVPQHGFAELSIQIARLNVLVLLAIPEGLEYKSKNKELTKEWDNLLPQKRIAFCGNVPPKTVCFRGQSRLLVGTKGLATMNVTRPQGHQ